MVTYIGVDPSLTSTGVAVIGSGTVHLSTIRTTGTKLATWQQRETRLRRIRSSVCEVAAAHRDDTIVVGIEGPAYAQNLGHSHDRAGLWWALYFALASYVAEIVVVPIQARIRYATGKGAGGKDVVLAAAIKRYADVEIGGNDEADALLIAALLARRGGEPIEDKILPKACLVALDKIER